MKELLTYSPANTALCMEQITNNILQLGLRHNIRFDDLVHVPNDGNPKIKTLETISGKLVSRGLLKVEEIAVAKVKADADTRLREHFHEEVEVIRMLKGTMHLVIDDCHIHILNANDIITIPHGVMHAAYWPEESEYLAVTMPASHAYPEG